MPVHSQRGDLVEGSWDDLFDFLDPARPTRQGSDRDSSAEAKYAEIVRKLTHFFAGRRCPDPEDLAIETILRVAARCRGVDVSGFTDRAGYFYGVARNVLHEWARDALRDSSTRERLKRELPGADGLGPDAWAHREIVDRHLENCLARLTRRARQLILTYYGEEGGARIAAHQALADEAGKSTNALRIEIHRIRKALRECVTAALGRAERPARPWPARGTNDRDRNTRAGDVISK